ncbi:MAG TPA: iron dependent repressor, metal binding and dimerization domain protein [Candidatus Limnocylindria bacterium]|nr:iron dependent repressor, metal binding and dimerization domain protein [Candidatus Limnocylindria bacterium]
MQSSKRDPSARSESTEDHLERIQELVDRHGYARVSDLAEELELSRSAVSNMVRRLATRGFVNYQRYRGFTLTESGRSVAAHIKDRHRTLSQFLEQLGIEEATIAEEVEDIEHHLRPQTLKALRSLVEYWNGDPKALAAFQKYYRRTAKS